MSATKEDEDRSRQLYRYYIEDWERYVRPSEDRAQPYEKFSVEYAQLAVRISFILNGGGIVSLAPILQNVSPTAGATIIKLAVWFVGGIVCGAACCLAAYINFQALAHQVRSRAVVTDFTLRGFFGFVPKPGENHPEAKASAEKDLSLGRLINTTLWLGVIAGIAAYVCLVIGAWQISDIASVDRTTSMVQAMPNLHSVKLKK